MSVVTLVPVFIPTRTPVALRGHTAVPDGGQCAVNGRCLLVLENAGTDAVVTIAAPTVQGFAVGGRGLARLPDIVFTVQGGADPIGIWLDPRYVNPATRRLSFQVTNPVDVRVSLFSYQPVQ